MTIPAGLGNANIRLDQSNDDETELGHEPMDVQVEAADEEVDQPEYDDAGNILKIDHADGSITISLDGKPVERSTKVDNDEAWFANLADKLDEDVLTGIAEDLLRGIDDDLRSRIDWVDDRTQGIKLLGLKIEVPNVSSGSDGAPVEGMSKVRHPLLQEAVLRFQANARSEMLPTDGPVKIRDDSNNPNLGQDQLATAFEKDLNHYLTVTASEYYPDTDRMFLLLGFGGTTFKKVYKCPLRNRPVSETVDAEDLIVNNNATDLQNALRVTHRVNLKPSVVKRLQILGVYRDIDLGVPMAVVTDALQDEKKAQQGIAVNVDNPEDRNRLIYETYCELDLPGYEHTHKGKPTGLTVPYRVTIDVSSRKILSIVRNYNRRTKELPEARKTFVKYTFVPGFGFYDIGLLHILGNTTNAVTAAWRELLDAGMYANFPGFLMSDSGGRQLSTLFRIPPGGSATVKTGGMPIGQAIMPLPYKDPSPALMGLVDNIATTGMRVGGTSELQVGEGRADAPVGTTLAMIEQATKVLNSVHKRMHAAQAEEFQMLVEVFRENPSTFWERNPTPSAQWNEETFLRALDTVALVPQADPNTASHSQRLMKVMGLKQLQAANPALYDEVAVDSAALQALGWSNPEQFLKPAGSRNQPPPEVMKAMAELQLKGKEVDIKGTLAQADVQLKQAQAQKLMTPEAAPGVTGPDPRELELKAQAEANKVRIAEMGFQRDQMNDDSRDRDREAEVEIERMRLQREHARDADDRAHEIEMQSREHQMTALQLAAQIHAAKQQGKQHAK